MKLLTFEACGVRQNCMSHGLQSSLWTLNFITRVLYKTFTDAVMLPINNYNEPVTCGQFIL